VFGCKKRPNVVTGDARIEKCVHCFVKVELIDKKIDKACTSSGNKVKEKKTTAPPYFGKRCPKSPQCVHIEQQVRITTVHKNAGHRLPETEFFILVKP